MGLLEQKSLGDRLNFLFQWERGVTPTNPEEAVVEDALPVAHSSLRNSPASVLRRCPR
jgi:hypothetical protein